MKYHKKNPYCLKWGKIGEAPPTELPRLPLKTPSRTILCIPIRRSKHQRYNNEIYLHKGKKCRRAKARKPQLLPERLLPRPVTRKGMGNGGPRESWEAQKRPPPKSDLGSVKLITGSAINTRDKDKGALLPLSYRAVVPTNSRVQTQNTR